MKIQNYAHEIHGCLKFFDNKQDRDHIENGDVFVYFDDDGKKAVDLLQNSGFEITAFHIKRSPKLNIQV